MGCQSCHTEFHSRHNGYLGKYVDTTGGLTTGPYLPGKFRVLSCRAILEALFQLAVFMSRLPTEPGSTCPASPNMAGTSWIILRSA
jgi:hypothetical protein